MSKFSPSLPTGDANGLASIIADLVDRPEELHVAIVVLDTAKLIRNVDSGDVVPTIRIRQIEPVKAGPDADEMRRLLRRAFEARTGKVELPLELERELDGLAVNTGTGEKIDGAGDQFPTGSDWGDPEDGDR
jgi:hypothetical protein